MPNTYTGFHAVEERVRRYSLSKEGGVTLTVYYSKAGPRIKKILSLAKECGIQAIQTRGEDLDKMVASLPALARDHRGIVLCAEGEKAKASNEVQLDQWLTTCPEKATVVILDNVTDPHNIGAVLRSCDQFGAALLIVPQRHSAASSSDAFQENQVIARSSAGASSWVPLASVANLVRVADMLKEAGFWLYGADAGGSSLQNVTFADKSCIIMGSEGSGMSRLLAKQCDTVVSIPTCGKIDSLNVSVAAGVLLYERYRQSL